MVALEKVGEGFLFCQVLKICGSDFYFLLFSCYFLGNQTEVKIMLRFNWLIMFRVVQNKLQNLAGQHSDVLENLTPKVRKRVETLREIQACPFPSFIFLFIFKSCLLVLGFIIIIFFYYLVVFINQKFHGICWWSLDIYWLCFNFDLDFKSKSEIKINI